MDKLFKFAAIGDESGYLVKDDKNENGGEWKDEVLEIKEEGGSDAHEEESGVGIGGGSENEKRVVRKEQLSGVRRQLDFNEIQNVTLVDSDGE